MSLPTAHRDFVDLLVSGIGPEDAARQAGYSAKMAAVLLGRADVMQALQAGMDGLRGIKSLKGLAVMDLIASGEKFPASARVTAARALMEFGGLIGRRNTNEIKDPSEMSAGELRDFIGRLDRELGDRARHVGAPIASPIDQQVADMLE